jgi:hypothetical protein
MGKWTVGNLKSYTAAPALAQTQITNNHAPSSLLAAPRINQLPTTPGRFGDAGYGFHFMIWLGIFLTLGGHLFPQQPIGIGQADLLA